MQIVFEKVGDVAVTAVPVEELDASNAGEFKRDITPVLDANAKLVTRPQPPSVRRQLRPGCVHLLPAKTERQRRRPEAVWHVEAGSSGLRARAHASGLRHRCHQGGRGTRLRAGMRTSADASVKLIGPSAAGRGPGSPSRGDRFKAEIPGRGPNAHRVLARGRDPLMTRRRQAEIPG